MPIKQSAIRIAGVAGLLAFAIQPAAAAVNEIVVTAQKREEGLQDVPIAVTAFTTEMLDDAAFDSFVDYAKSVPGLSFSSLGPGQTGIVLRGLPLITGVPTVGVYIDGISLAANFQSPDPRLFDVERVEVLRGPQGTLFGEGSIGGLINIRTNRPDSETFSAKIDASYSNTNEADDGNYEVSGMINIPIVEDRLAIRGVGFFRDYGGFIDRIDTASLFSGMVAQEDANTEEWAGGRVAAELTPTDRLTVTLRGTYQKLEIGSADFNTSAPLNTTFGLPFLSVFNDAVPGFEDEQKQVSIEAVYDFDFAELTAVGGFFERDLFRDNQLGVFDIENDTRTWQGEVRLASQNDGRFNWIFGATYRDINVVTKANVAGPVSIVADFRPDREQYALFGQIYWDILSNVTLTVGGRYFHENQSTTISTIFVPPVLPPSASAQSGSFDDFSPKVSIDWQVTDAALLYASFSKGFRSGGINVDIVMDPAFKPTFDPDKVWAYELGAKTSWFEDRLVVNGAVFYNDWSDLQVDGIPNNSALGFTVNAGSAHSFGVEVEATATPFEGLEITAGGAWIEAELDEESLGSPKGSQLPNTSEWQFNVSGQYTHPFIADFDCFVRGDFSWQSDQFSNLPNDPLNNSESFENLNLRAGIENDWLSLSIFAENVTDNLQVTSTDLSDTPPNQFVARPRTIGVRVQASYN